MQLDIEMARKIDVCILTYLYLYTKTLFEQSHCQAIPLRMSVPGLLTGLQRCLCLWRKRGRIQQRGRIPHLQTQADSCHSLLPLITINNGVIP